MYIFLLKKPKFFFEKSYIIIKESEIIKLNEFKSFEFINIVACLAY